MTDNHFFLAQIHGENKVHPNVKTSPQSEILTLLKGSQRRQAGHVLYLNAHVIASTTETNVHGERKTDLGKQ